MPGEHQGRVVLVTGGTGALGRAVVRHFVRAGATVHATRRGELQGFDTYLGSDFSKLQLHQADLTAEDDVNRLVGEVTRASGRLDVLANIAGGFAYAPLAETSMALWDRMIKLNATSAFLCCRAAAPVMVANRWGRIINVSSAPAVSHGAANMTAYVASKAALTLFTESLAKELVKSGVTVNAVVPTVIDTEDNRRSQPTADTSSWLKPEEIAEVTGFLAGAAAGIVTGAVVNLSRG
jgi:NAD(P)-dependent dehydrogenase (short-subunit alcohol dehydrogenase family)